MKPQKPDRFERVATENIFTVHGITGVELVTRGACAYLLRNEHAWMRRMVRQHMQSIDGLRADLHPDFVDGYMQAGREFLALLAQRRK